MTSHCPVVLRRWHWVTSFPSAESDGSSTPLPGVAPVAMQEGGYAARVVAIGCGGYWVWPFRDRTGPSPRSGAPKRSRTSRGST